MDPSELSLLYTFVFALAISEEVYFHAKPSKHYGHLFHMLADLQSQARRLNKFRDLCGTRFFYFFPKLLIQFIAKKKPWRLRAIDNFPLFYRLSRPNAIGINVGTPCPRPARISRIPRYLFLTILAKCVEDDSLDIRFLTSLDQ